MKKLMNVLMLSCIKATEFVEKKLDNKLNMIEKIQLYLHTRMCGACRLYEKQSKFIDEVLKRYLNGSIQIINEEQTLSNKIKEKIIRNIK
ncbi:MAG: hypothetical protein M3421_07285 [Bacteroidota bacterium]|nr:hypothetical protein [Bacteroidota bacterium]